MIDNSNNQAPIFKFLNKHKWRIILPMIFALFYFALPRYLSNHTAVQQELFIKSPALNQTELKQNAIKIQGKTLSNEYLSGLINKYDLYKTERNKNIEENFIIEKLRNAIEVRLGGWEYEEGIHVHIWIVFRAENAQHITEISKDVAAQFENTPNLQVNKYFSKPYDADPWRNWVFFADIAVQGLLLFSIPLILIWEIPYLFYSPRTKQFVFEPLKSDWQNELAEAKLGNKTWKSFEINIRYIFAFISAMWQKSPIGDLIEYISKLAK